MLPAIDASPPRGPTPDAMSPQDASAADATGPVCSGSWLTVFDSFSAIDHPVGVWAFDRRGDFMDFVRNIAVQYSFVDPTTGVTCTTIMSCTYDPTLPRVSPQDVTHSNALDEFIGPDGKSYVWTYYQPLNQWFLAEAERDPQAYRWIVEYNAGCLPNCPCDAG